MVCPQCGANTDTKFCQFCGIDLTKVAVNEEKADIMSDAENENAMNKKAKASVENLEKEFEKIDENKLISAIGMLPEFFWVPLVVNRKNEKYAQCASNGLLLRLVVFAIGVAFGLVFEVLGWMPSVSLVTGFSSILIWIRDILYLALDILSYVGFVSVFMGKEFKYPVIGKKNIFKNI